MKRYNILLTNDDGYNAEGIKAIYHTLKERFNLFVLAPETEQSGFSHKITLKTPLHLQPFEDGDYKGYKLNGTPTDCTKLALQNLYKDRIDLVISGINRGSNNGISVHYSGTVAAVVEGAFFNIPGIAISLFSYMDRKFENGAKFLLNFLEQHIEKIIERGSILNINIPDLENCIDQKPIFCKQGLANFNSDYKHIEHVGQNFYWAGGPGKDKPKGEDDDHYILKNRITITPLDIDLTNERELKFWQN